MNREGESSSARGRASKASTERAMADVDAPLPAPSASEGGASLDGSAPTASESGSVSTGAAGSEKARPAHSTPRGTSPSGGNSKPSRIFPACRSPPAPAQQTKPRKTRKKDEFRCEIVEHTPEVQALIASLVDCPEKRFQYTKKEVPRPRHPHPACLPLASAMMAQFPGACFATTPQRHTGACLSGAAPV